MLVLTFCFGLLPLDTYSSNLWQALKNSPEINQLDCLSKQPWETEVNGLNCCLRTRWEDLELETNQEETDEDRAPEPGGRPVPSP